MRRPPSVAVSGHSPGHSVPHLGQDRQQLVVVREVDLSSPADPYLTLKALATYSGCSQRWLRDRLTDPSRPLPCYRVPSRKGGKDKILVRRSAFDDWLARYRTEGPPGVGRIVNEVLGELLSPYH